jgi:glycosyltransferase involved in cell wall biosynthesis
MRKKVQFPISKVSGKRKPVVLISTPLYPPYTGGGPTYFSTLVYIMNDKVDFVVHTMQNPKKNKFETEGNVFIYRIQPYMLYSPTVVKYAVIAPVTMLSLFYLWLKYRPRAIHAHSNGIFGLLVSLFSKIFNIDLIKEVQDMQDPAFNIKSGNVVKFIACGGAVEKKLLSIGIPSNKIVKYPAINPPDCKQIYTKLKPEIEKRQADQDKGKRVKLIFIGWLDRKDKGIDILLKAYKIVLSKVNNVSLTLVGNGPDIEYCQDYIKNNDLNHVELLGSIDYGSAMKELSRSDIVILPSRFEAQGRAIIEGYQFGKPAVGTRVFGIPELIEHGKTGLLVEPENPDEMAKAIIKLIKNEKLRDTMGAEGRKFLATQPAWDKLADDFYELYVKGYV